MKVPKIHISNSFLIFLCGYGILDPYKSFRYFMISVALHEGMHIATLCWRGHKLREIRCTALGMELHTDPLCYEDELWVAAAGPLGNLILLLLSMGRVPILAMLNLGLLCYNLLPFYPLDGGRILRCFLFMIFSPGKAQSIEKTIGLLTYGIVLGVSVYLTVVLHSGLWPILFCSLLFCRIGSTIIPDRKTILRNSQNSS